MYEAFYGLKEKPFSLTPDPKYLFLSDKHKEAFAHLMYGIKNGNGFVMITGEIGTGKTTLSRNLVQQLDEDTELAFIFNPPLSPLELMKKINAEFGVDSNSDHVVDLVETLNTHLLQATTDDKNCVLVIDEAQTLTPLVLEQVRLLSNLETETQKLLQIVLIGQPELGEMLGLRELRQLNQRITARYHLEPLSEKETLQYIAYRLHVAGGRRKVKFSKSAIHAIYRLSRGTPRVINALCDRALLIGYTREARVITAPIIRQAGREIWGEKATLGGYKRPVGSWLPRPATAIIALLLVLIIGLLIRQPRFSRSTDSSPAEHGLAASPAEATTTRELAPLAQEAARSAKPAREAKKPAPSAPASDAHPKVSSLDTLLTTRPFESIASDATAAVFRSWGVDAVIPPNEWSAARVVMEAVEQGMAVEQLSPALEQLLAINLPALVKVRASGDVYWLALLRREGDRLLVAGAPGSPIPTTVGELKTRYAGEAVVLWRDPAPNTPVLTLGSHGPGADHLKSMLRQLGRLSPDNKDDRYDAHTASAVAKLQAETGLLVDSIAGQQVRMVLNSWIPATDGPTLEDRAGPPADQEVAAAVAPAQERRAPARPRRAAPAPAAAPKERPAEAAAVEVQAAPVLSNMAPPPDSAGAVREDQQDPAHSGSTTAPPDQPTTGAPVPIAPPRKRAGLDLLLDSEAAPPPAPASLPERTAVDEASVEVEALPGPDPASP